MNHTGLVVPRAELFRVGHFNLGNSVIFDAF